MTPTRRLAVAMATALLAVVAPSSASAITIDALTTQPASTQAGSHPNFNLSMTFGGGSTPKAMRIALPPGFVGNPNALAKCPQATFEAGNCGSDAVVGSTTVHTRAGLPGTGGGGGGGGGGVLDPLDPILDPLDPVTEPVCNLLPALCGTIGLRSAQPRAASRASQRQLALELPLQVPGVVYNLEPSQGEPARLGIEILESIRIQSTIEVRDGSDFGLTSVLDNLPNEFLGAPLRIARMDLTLLGALPNGNSFVTLPTSCAPATTSVDVTPYQGAAASAQASFTPTGCENVPFNTGLSVVPSTTRVSSNAAYAITLGVGGEEQPIRNAHVSKVAVSLPEGAGLNPGAAQGLEACTDAQFARGERKAPSCPAASQIGTVSFTSPLVGTLNGTVYEGEPKPNQMIRLFVDVPGPGLRIKLVGNVNPDPRTGQVHSEFSGLPQLPFTAFTLTFRGGDKSILTTPPTCAQALSTATLTPYSGTAPATVGSAFDPTWDGQQPCPAQLPFNPSVGVRVDPSTAGANTTMTQTVNRDERDQRLKDMKLSFPPGLVGGLGAGIELCEPEKARHAACPEGSRVGSATLVAGPGPQPLNIAGEVFITAPHEPGTLASLAITVPGKVGPFDLGTTVSMAHISVRPSDSGLEVTANDLPQIVGGIPLNLRRVRLQLDRKGFMRNATSCAEQALNATFTSSAGATAQGSTTYRATDCDKVPFAPKLVGAVGKASQLAKGGSPEVTAVVTQKAGEIANREVEVTLPPEVSVGFDRVAIACPVDQDCGDRNVVGEATAITPLLPIPLTGPVKLVTPPGGGLPGLQLELAGLLSITLAGKTEIQTDGRVRNTFAGIPDVPLSRFELKINGGPKGILINNRRLRCGERLEGQGVFTGHSGAKSRSTGTFEVCGDVSQAASKAKKRKLRVKAKLRKGSLRVVVRAPRKVGRVKVTLPKPARIAGGKKVKARVIEVRGDKNARTKAARRKVVASKVGKRVVRLTVGKKALRGARKAKRAERKVRVAVKMGKQRASRKVRIR